MEKTFCDICKKDMTNQQKKYFTYDENWWIGRPTHEICTNCFKNMRTYLRKHIGEKIE